MKKFAFSALLALGVVALMAPPVAFATDDEKPFKIHGEVRTRLEYTNNTQDFTDQDASTAPFDSDDGAGYFPYRIRIAAEGQFTDDVSGWIEFQNTGVFGEQGLVNQFLGTSDQTNARRFNDGKSLTQMYQAYINMGKLWSDNFSLRIGRQEVVLGNEFIFGDEDFYTGISHDAIVGMWDLKSVDITAWYARTVEDSVYQYGLFPTDGGAQDVPPDLVVINPSAFNMEHFGAYVTFGVGKDKSQDVDVYIVNVNDRAFGGRFQTLGARYGRDGWDKGGLVWNIEYAIQMGEFASELVSGFDESAGGSAAEGLIGWNFKGDKNVHRVFAKMEMATGEQDGDDPTTPLVDEDGDDEFEGFVPLFGEVHNRTGHGDWFRVQHDPTGLGGAFISGGLEAWALGYTGMFGEKHEIGAQYWDYSTETDAYTFVAPGAPKNPTDLGKAFDIWYGYKYSKNVAIEASYSSLSPGDALTSDGDPTTSDPDDTVERLYANLRLRF